MNKVWGVGHPYIFCGDAIHPVTYLTFNPYLNRGMKRGEMGFPAAKKWGITDHTTHRTGHSVIN